jgi:hypothetical protein
MNEFKTHTIWTILLPLLISLIFAAGPALRPAEATSGSAYYVAPSGDDSNPGTQEEPWKTIQHAVDTANPGDIIYLRAGGYDESVRFRQSGQEGTPITLTNYDGEAVTIDGGGDPAIVDLDGTQYWIIQGLTLDSDAEHTLLQGAWGCDGTCGGTHHWTIRNNRIIGAVSIYGSYNLFESNEVDGSQHKGSENGVWESYDVSHHNTFRNNEIHHFYIRGIWSMHRTHDDIFENNYIHDIGSATEGTCIDTDGFATVEWRHVIRGNYLHNCRGTAIALENTFDSIVENNIILDSGMSGIGIINYGPNIGEGSQRCQAGGESNQYGDTDGDNDCEGDLTGNIIRQNLIYNGAQQGAISIHHAGGVSIWGNTISNTSRWGIYLAGGVEFCPGISVRGNILAHNGEAEIYVTSLDSLTQDDHNLFDHAQSDNIYGVWGTWAHYTLSQYQAATGRGQGSIQADPRFVDPAGDNFHLQDISPAIDAGVNIGLTQDLDGNPRPQGAGYDIGTYESSAVGRTATPVPSPTPLPSLPTQAPTSLPSSPSQEPLPAPISSSLTPGVPLRTLTLTPTQINIHRDSAEEDSSIPSVVWDFAVSAFEWLVNLIEIAISKIQQFVSR